MSDISDDGVERGAAPVNQDLNKGPTYRVMLAVVIFLGVLVVIALAAVVAGLFVKMGGRGGATSASGAVAGYTLPAGGRIESMQVSANRLILRVKTDTGEEIDILDTADGRLVGQVKAAAPDIPK